MMAGMEDDMSARGKGEQDYLEAEAKALGEHLEKLVAAIKGAAQDKVEQAGDVGEKIGEGVDDGADDGADRARDAIARIGAAAQDLAERAAGLADEVLGKVRRVRDSAADSRHQLEDAVRERPLMSLALAALAGFVLASMLPSRGRAARHDHDGDDHNRSDHNARGRI
jgi:ElaB/YqjD/DUF883 family membrane-anchored ribosome-binding protein